MKIYKAWLLRIVLLVGAAGVLLFWMSQSKTKKHDIVELVPPELINPQNDQRNISVPNKEERQRMSHAQRIELLERLGYVPNNANMSDFFSAEKHHGGANALILLNFGKIELCGTTALQSLRHTDEDVATPRCHMKIHMFWIVATPTVKVLGTALKTILQILYGMNANLSFGVVFSKHTRIHQMISPDGCNAKVTVGFQ